MACASCRDFHTPALLNTALPCEGALPQRGVTVITPDGVKMTWDEYQREMERRAEAWSECEGEGPE